ncbi:MAG: (Fe-S)-binding protein [Bacteroidales bacterium]
MEERFLSGYNNFVIPFMVGMVFILVYCLLGLIKMIYQLPIRDRNKFLLSLITPTLIFKNIKDILLTVLLHVKMWKKNPLLGFMHSSIAFGWFCIIIIGHIETLIYVPHRVKLFYYPIFFRYFVMSTHETVRGAFLCFLMDSILLIILLGIALAVIKRIRSSILGMRRTTKQSLINNVAMIALWSIFPLRLLAEGFTAGISGGSFLTKGVSDLFGNFFSNDLKILPSWWAYSISLGVFFVLLPWTRYMHIPTEAIYIMFKNAGIKASHPTKGYALAEIYTCPSCGLCIDACPMGTQKKNLPYSSVYFIRQLRNKNKEKIEEIANKCLMCGKCVEACPQGLDSVALKLAQRSLIKPNTKNDFSYLSRIELPKAKPEKVLYYAGCMTQLTPTISRSVTKLLDIMNVDYNFIDEEGGMCCGRPMLLAGKTYEAERIVRKNSDMILATGASTLIVSCPICYKMFKEKYNLPGINIINYTEYFDQKVKEGKLPLKSTNKKYVYHDPCELGRGSGIYKQPREIIANIGYLVEADESKNKSICCGGSLGSLTLSYEDRTHITDLAVRNLLFNKPDEIVTACPLCYKTFSNNSPIKVKDISQILVENITNNNKLS